MGEEAEDTLISANTSEEDRKKYTSCYYCYKIVTSYEIVSCYEIVTIPHIY